MSIFKKRAMPLPNPRFTALEGEAMPVEMTATEIRRQREVRAYEAARMVAATTSSSSTITGGSASGGWGTTGAGAAWTTTSTTGPWTTTITDTNGFTYPPKEEFNVYRLTGLPEVGLYLRLEGDYYCPLADVGQPTPNIAFANVGVELVGNLLDWAMEALNE